MSRQSQTCRAHTSRSIASRRVGLQIQTLVGRVWQCRERRGVTGLIPVQHTNHLSSLAINESLTLEAQSLQALPNAIGANPSITLWGSTEMPRPEWPNSEARRAERHRVLGEGMFPSLPDGGCGQQCKQPGDLKHFIGVQSCSWCESNLFQ